MSIFLLGTNLTQPIQDWIGDSMAQLSKMASFPVALSYRCFSMVVAFWLVTEHGAVVLCVSYLTISRVQDWELAQPGGVLATTAHSFDSDPEISDVDEDDRETVFSSMDMLSPSGHSDAQTLAMMLQEQLDAINEEIRYEMHPL